MPQKTHDDRRRRRRHTNKINGDSSRSRFHELFCARTLHIHLRGFFVNFISKSVYLDHLLRFKDAATNACAHAVLRVYFYSALRINYPRLLLK